MRYRKKPVVIDAALFDEFDIPGARFHPELSDLTRGKIVIPTLEGDVTASGGDFIIRGVKGEFYPCKPDIFAATYEAAE